MTRSQINYLSMYRAVYTFLTNNAAVYAGKTAFMALVALLDSQIKAIILLGSKTAGSTTGATTQKNDDKLALANMASGLAGEGVAYASANNLSQLKATLSITADDIMLANDNVAIEICLAIWTALSNVIADMVGYDITQLELDAFKLSIDNFDLAVSNKVYVKSDHKNQVELLEAAIRTTRLLINEQLVGMMDKYKVSNYGFYKGFNNAKRLQQSGGGRKKYEMFTGTVLPGELFNLTDLGITADTIMYWEILTDADGRTFIALTKTGQEGTMIEILGLDNKEVNSNDYGVDLAVNKCINIRNLSTTNVLVFKLTFLKK